MGNSDEHPKKSRNLLRKVSGWIDRGLMNMFGAIALFVANRPVKVLVASVIIGILCGAGIIRLNVLTDSEDLYTPQENEAFDDQKYVEKKYGYGEIEVNYYAISKGSDLNVINKESLLALLDVYEEILDVKGSLGGEELNLESFRICYRPGGNSFPCDIVSALDYWNYSRVAIQNDKDIFSTVNQAGALDRLGRELTPKQIFGKIDLQNGLIVSAGAFQIVITLQNNKPKSSSSSTDKFTDAWQKAAVSAFKKYSNPTLKVFLNSPYDVEQVSDSSITNDVNLLVVGYLLLFIYGVIVLFKGHSIESQANLAMANIGSIGLAVLSCFGLCALCGVPFSLVTQALALLLLGLGTDDMLVTMASHDETGVEMPDAPIVDRVVATVSRARRGVIVTSLTNFVAFATGISSELPALSYFLIYATVGVITLLFFQSTFFVACITLDLKRQRAKRIDTLCCFTSSAEPEDGCCGRKYDTKSPGITQRIIGVWLPKILLNPVVKVLVLIITVFLAVMGGIGASKVKQNFDDEWFIPDGSHILDVYKIRDDYFRGSFKGAFPFAIYTKNDDVSPLDYFDYQDQLQNIKENLNKNKYVSQAPPVESWYSSYVDWLNATYPQNLTSEGRPKTSSDFYAFLRVFLKEDGKRFINDIKFSNATNTNVITSSRISGVSISLYNSIDQVDAMRSLRKVADESAPNLDAIAYTFPFLFYEGFAVIEKDTLKAIIIAAAIVFVIILFMVADLLSSITVGILVACIDLELVGFIHWAGLSFNSVTGINLLLAIGIAVDYSALMAFSFLTKTGTRNERVEKALNSFGVAIFNGGFTLYLAVLPTAFASSYIFQVFFKMFSMIVLLGLWHGLCTLPVILSFIGSEPYDSAINHGINLKEAEMGRKDHLPPFYPQVPPSLGTMA